ncbi:MAG: glycosyltransferase family A protein [Oculatellaceae cyanobacterium bins.114]|nr:glycosyltransferase family A protein [Oculatellaceae cyanobacterium bins.114]
MKQAVTVITHQVGFGEINAWATLLAVTWLDVRQLLSVAEIQADSTVIRSEVVVYLPHLPTRLSQMTSPVMPSHPFLMPWFPSSPLPTETAIEAPFEAVAWIASTELVQQALPQLVQLKDWSLLNLAQILEQLNLPFYWGTVSALPVSSITCPTSTHTVLAVVPHYCCELWLARCLRSLLAQTRPPDHIVVIDDASNRLPAEIVESFPSVTLLAASQRVGPYRLIQQVIDDTHYWGYLFQDADDWSSSDRLQQLMYLALTTGAELVGTQEMRVNEDTARCIPINYPLDVNAALATKPGHAMLHPTSLVTRDLVQRLGGFATGLRFGGDTEFLLRAVWVAQVINLPSYSYFRRKRPNSLTTDPATGLESPARRQLLHQLKQGAIARQATSTAGQQPDLRAIATAPAIQLTHITGPCLH